MFWRQTFQMLMTIICIHGRTAEQKRGRPALAPHIFARAETCVFIFKHFWASLARCVGLQPRSSSCTGADAVRCEWMLSALPCPSQSISLLKFDGFCAAEQIMRGHGPDRNLVSLTCDVLPKNERLSGSRHTSATS